MCMLLALRTEMRAAELTLLSWDQVFDRHVHLPLTTSDRPRETPLSNKDTYRNASQPLLQRQTYKTR